MKTILAAALISLTGLTGMTAIAHAEGAIANDTTTSLSSPRYSSPSYSAPHPSLVSGQPAQEEQAERLNRAKPVKRG